MVLVFVGLAIYCEIPIILFDTRIRKSELGNISKVRIETVLHVFVGLVYCEIIYIRCVQECHTRSQSSCSTH